MMLTDKILNPLCAFILGIFLISCIADPWPEPDSMEPGLKGTDSTDNYAEDRASDEHHRDSYGGGTDGKGDSENDTDTAEVGDAGTDSDSGVLSDSELRTDKVFISSPNVDGYATVVGLAGAVDADAQVSVNRDGINYPVSVSREGGFVARFPADTGESVSLSISSDGSDKKRTTLSVGVQSEEFEDGIVGGGFGIGKLSSTMVSINGEGAHLNDNQMVIAGNISSGTSGAARVLCEGGTCMFSLLITATSGDVLDLFLINMVGTEFILDDHYGTVVDTLIVD